MKNLGNRLLDAFILGGLVAIIVGHFKIAIEHMVRGDMQAGIVILTWGLWLIVVLITLIKTAIARRKDAEVRKEIITWKEELDHTKREETAITDEN